MRSGNYPLFLAELAIGDQDFSLPAMDGLFRFRGRDVLWHKERLLNLIIDQLPANFTKVAWVDADVLFPESDWYAQASQLLDTFPLIQLYERMVQLNNDGRPVRAYHGLAASIAGGERQLKFDGGASFGLAWAARREILLRHGLLDDMVIGVADAFMCLAAYGRLDRSYDWYLRRLAPRYREAWSRWAEGFHDDIRGNVGFVPTSVVQLGHGSLLNRQYVESMSILVRHDFDPAVDIAPNHDGVWEWSSPKPALHQEVREYFQQRREDDNEPSREGRGKGPVV